MPFDLAALQERLGGDNITEIFNEEMASSDSLAMRQLSETEIKKLFPAVQLGDTEHVAYVPTRMCHSLPKVNRRGRAFFPQVIKNSARSAQDNLVDLDHILKKHKHPHDKVIGHIKAVSFDPENTWEVQIASAPNQSLLIPKLAVPLYALMALFKRTEDGNDIVDQCLKSRRKWKSSMECVAQPASCGFIYEDKYIEFANADSDMIECVEKTRVRPYKGKNLSFILGGLDGTVDFCGIGLTVSPADTDCDVLGMFASTLKETASTKNSMPIRQFKIGFPQEKREEALEIANVRIEEMLEEKAALVVIGQTQPSGTDNHIHDVLSDGTILPYGGHSHGVESIQIVTGTKPRYTGKCSTSYEYMRSPEGRELPYVHVHLFDILLKGKRSGSGSEVPADETSSLGDDEVFTSEEIMGIKDRLQKLEERLGSLGATPSITEVASIKEEIRQLRQSEEVANAISEGVTDKLTSGEFVTKEKHDADIAAAEKKAKDEAEAEAKKREAITKKLSDRIAEVTKIGVDVEAQEEGATKTVREIISAIEFDERGDREFSRELDRIKLKVQLMKKVADEKTAADATTQQAASVPRPFLLNAGGGAGGNGDGKGGSNGNGNGKGGLPSHFRTKQTIGR